MSDQPQWSMMTPREVCAEHDPTMHTAAEMEAHLRTRLAELEAEVRTLDWYRAAWHRTISLVEGSSTGMLSTRAVFEALLPPLGPRS